jgi:2-dehydro-3-deoxygluconokinase
MAEGAVDLVCLGEAMVEYNQTGADGGRTHLQGFGGDTSNVAIAAARQGARAAVAGAVGDDRHGRLLLDLWDAEGVDRASVRVDPDAPTGVYFVTHGARGHDFHFLRRGSAASRVGPGDLPLARIRGARVLHVSGISLAISEAARAAGMAAVAAARAAGVDVAFDTNLRLRLWPVERARPAIEAAIALADVCLPSVDDLAALTGEDDPDRLVDRCLRLGARTVALKLGARGALVADATARHRIAPFPCRALDATGAGDTFDGAFLARRLAGDGLIEAGRYAAAAAALSTEGYGAVAPIPRADAVRALLRRAPADSPASSP